MSPRNDGDGRDELPPAPLLTPAGAQRARPRFPSPTCSDASPARPGLSLGRLQGSGTAVRLSVLAPALLGSVSHAG